MNTTQSKYTTAAAVLIKVRITTDHTNLSASFRAHSRIIIISLLIRDWCKIIILIKWSMSTYFEYNNTNEKKYRYTLQTISSPMLVWIICHARTTNKRLPSDGCFEEHTEYIE